MGVQLQTKPATANFPFPPITSFSTNPISREKPFLINRSGEYYVHVPASKTDSKGVSWTQGLSADGLTLPLSDFYVASPTDSASAINTQLNGKHLILLPGVYQVSESIVVSGSDTVVLGLGLATLKANQVSAQPLLLISGSMIIKVTAERKSICQSFRVQLLS